MRKLRQIVTKAVIAKGKKRVESTEKIKPPNNPTSILGCWVINHHYTAKKHGKFVEIQGKFDINIWYSYMGQSKTGVHSETIQYKDRIKLKYRDEDIRDSNEVNVKVLQQPNCIEAIILPSGETFEVVVEREFLVEVIGETTVCITVHPNEYEEEWSLEDSSSSEHRAESKGAEKDLEDDDYFSEDSSSI